MLPRQSPFLNILSNSLHR